jgi:hypothetical protein
MADVVRYSFYLPNPKGAGAYLIDIYQRQVGKTFRYMKIPIDAITEEQAKGICKIINDGGNIKNPCNYYVTPNTYDFEWKVIESLVRAESKVFDKIQTYIKNTKGLSAAPVTAPTTITRGQTIKSAAEMQQQAPKTYVLPITGTIIKSDPKEPKRYFFELPFFDQDAYDELFDDFQKGTYFIKWDSNVANNTNIAGFTFKEIVNATPKQTEEDLATLDNLIELYLQRYLAQKNAPAATQPFPDLTKINGLIIGDPYYLMPRTQLQVYTADKFNIPKFHFFLMGQKEVAAMAYDIALFIEQQPQVRMRTTLDEKLKDAPNIYMVSFELYENTLVDQEAFFTAVDEQLMKIGYLKPIKSSNAPKPNAAPKTDALLDIESNVDKLKTELDQLVFLRSLNSELDFEKNIELGQKIAKAKEQINQLNFSKLEAKLTTDDIFDQLFEQSFTPLQHVYTNLKVQQGEEGDFFTPNGQPSELSEQLNELIRTEQFKEWFGDWQLTYMYKQAGDTDTDCSVVLTENFEPKLFYHGTGQEFSYFKFDKFPAAYFAANQAYSQWFANLHGGDKGYTIPFFLNVRNPLDLTQFGTEEIRPKDFFDYMYLQTGLDAEQLEVNPLFLNPSAPARETWVYLRNNPKMLKKLADNQVYDGINFYETNPGVDKGLPAYQTEVYITFKPEQCKIADNNRGLILMASIKSFFLENGGKI